MSETYLGVRGRSQFLHDVARSRLHWRSTKTMIASCPVHFWTYDDLYIQAVGSLDIWRGPPGFAKKPMITGEDRARASPRILVIGDVMTDVIVRPEGPLARGSDRRATRSV